jgi:hypothetical protein
MAPERRTKKGTEVCPGENRISPGATGRTRPNERTRSICAGVSVGKIWVWASRTLGIIGGDMKPIFAPSFPFAAA